MAGIRTQSKGQVITEPLTIPLLKPLNNAIEQLIMVTYMQTQQFIIHISPT